MSEGRTSSIVYGAKTKLDDNLEMTLDRSFATSSNESTNSNIFGLSGDINDRWAASGSFERGTVQNHDGTQDKRNAGSLGLGFLDKDKETQDIKLKASSKIELRFDEGQEDKRQYLLYNTVEHKINPDTTLFAKANFSQTKNTTNTSTEAQYKELVLGSAYRPVNVDWLNLLAKYTYLEDDSPSSQTDMSDIQEEKSHILATEAVLDLTDKWQLSEKLAYKLGEEKVSGFDFTKTQTWLYINRLGFNINRDWQIAGEYRILTQKQAEDRKQGALIELARNIDEYLQIGVGYNFTDFNDDLTNLDYTAHGPFFRITGKLYDRTPEEIERSQQRAFGRKKKGILGVRIKERFKKQEDEAVKKVLALFEQANEALEAGEFEKAKEKYNQVIVSLAQIEIEEILKIDEIIEREEEIRAIFESANRLYKDGKVDQALERYNKCADYIKKI